MDNRSEAFVRKLSDALVYLGNTSIHDLVSIKYHNDTSPSEYREFIGYLQTELNLETKQVNDNLQGHAWLAKDNSENKALLIEHETGLEILYIAGSIASLLSLIPLINSAWKFMHNRFSDHSFFQDKNTGVEIRIIDSRNQLVEQRVFEIEDYILSESMKELTTLKARVGQLERDLKEINEKANKASTKKTARPAQRSKK